MVEFLLSAGANPNIREATGLIPLHWAASHGNLEIVRALVSAGADIAAKNHRGKTPLQEARERNRTVIVGYLRSVTAKTP
jgi:ankyrin repeat protein